MKEEVNYFFVVVLIALVVLVLLGSYLTGQGIFDFLREGRLSPLRTELASQELDEIKQAKEKIAESSEHDFSTMYNLLGKNKNKKDKILKICGEFDPIYCLKKASQQNPDLRGEIC
ncbi:hypothetical protein HYV50_02655 [Candidatus Pacearchaeota archaeon]|nr:hypothetical protein [Candidatus Pacearchaeota archaeon]